MTGLTRWLAAAVLALGAPVSAWAIDYDMVFCFEYDTDYDDATGLSGDDYFTSNHARPARGARVRVVRNSDGYVEYEGYVPWQGSDAGCTPTLSLSDVPIASRCAPGRW